MLMPTIEVLRLATLATFEESPLGHWVARWSATLDSLSFPEATSPRKAERYVAQWWQRWLSAIHPQDDPFLGEPLLMLTLERQSSGIRCCLNGVVGALTEDAAIHSAQTHAHMVIGLAPPWWGWHVQQMHIVPGLSVEPGPDLMQIQVYPVLKVEHQHVIDKPCQGHTPMLWQALHACASTTMIILTAIPDAGHHWRLMTHAIGTEHDALLLMHALQADWQSVLTATPEPWLLANSVTPVLAPDLQNLYWGNYPSYSGPLLSSRTLGSLLSIPWMPSDLLLAYGLPSTGRGAEQ